jgi:hypothetical protein
MVLANDGRFVGVTDKINMATRLAESIEKRNV